MAMAAIPACCLRLTASWDANSTTKPFSSNSIRNLRSLSSEAAEAAAAAATTATEVPLFQLSNTRRRNAKQGKKLDEAYLGYERWSPVAPKGPTVNKPRSVHNAATLAYLGDGIYELYARRHFLYPPLSIDEYNERVTSLVRCEAQDTLLKKLLEEDFLTEEERDILRWGRNIAWSKRRTRKRGGVAVYSRASSLETLIGHLHLTDVKRLEDLMHRLGFSSGSSSEKIVEKMKNIDT